MTSAGTVATAGGGAATGVGGEGSRSLVVAERAVGADGVVVLHLAAPGGESLPRWEPGAHIDLVLGDLVRQYSLCGDPADEQRWRIAVLLEPHGRGGSRLVHERLHPGAAVEVRGPRNHFPLRPARRYLFIAGGIGITPLLPMLARTVATGAEAELVYGGRRRTSMAFRDELVRYGDRVRLHPEDEFGPINLDAMLGAPRADTLVYCCGPESLLAAVEARCAAWPQDSLHVERFARAVDDRGAPAETFQVVFERSGVTAEVPPGRSIVDVAEEAGIPVPASCRDGVCGTCETRVLAGVPDHRDAILDETERAAGDVAMICVSRALSPELRLDL